MQPTDASYGVDCGILASGSLSISEFLVLTGRPNCWFPQPAQSVKKLTEIANVMCLDSQPILGFANILTAVNTGESREPL